MDHREELMHNEQELAAELKNDGDGYECRLCLNEWYHCDSQSDWFAQLRGDFRDNDVDVRKRHNSMFTAIAECIIDGTNQLYERMKQAGALPDDNTHWSYWPLVTDIKY